MSSRLAAADDDGTSGRTGLRHGVPGLMAVGVGGSDGYDENTRLEASVVCTVCARRVFRLAVAAVRLWGSCCSLEPGHNPIAGCRGHPTAWFAEQRRRQGSRAAEPTDGVCGLRRRGQRRLLGYRVVLLPFPTIGWRTYRSIEQLWRLASGVWRRIAAGRAGESGPHLLHLLERLHLRLHLMPRMAVCRRRDTSGR